MVKPLSPPSNRRRGKGLEALDDLIPVYDRPKLFEILFLAPNAVIKEPTVFVHTDAKQGIDVLPERGEVTRVLWAEWRGRRGGGVIEGACACSVVVTGQHRSMERPCWRRGI